MPCRGCGKKTDDDGVDKLSRFKMKFVGRPNGVLMKGAPGNYNQNEIYSQPYRMSHFPFWQLLDPPPVLKVPPAKVEDSVFENQVFIPPDLDDATKKEEVPSSGPLTSESSVKSTSGSDASTNYQELFEAIKGMKGKEDHVVNPLEPIGGFPPLVEQPFKEEPVKLDDDMPPELRYELKMMGDGVIGEEKKDEGFEG